MTTAVQRYEGQVRLWWTSADGQASEEIDYFPDGATFAELTAAESQFWTDVEDQDEDSISGYAAGTVTAEADGKAIAEF